MNKVTRDIMDLLDCGLEDALKVQDHMLNIQGIDLSECSKAEFNKAVRKATVVILIPTEVL